MTVNRLPATGAVATRSSVVIDGFGRLECDRTAAIALAREYGGRVEVSSVRIFPDGSEHLGGWREADRWELEVPREVFGG